MNDDQGRFDDEFERIINSEELDSVAEITCESATSAHMAAAHSLVDSALRLIRRTAPPALNRGQAWLGSIRILGDMAHAIANDHLDEAHD